MKIKEIKKHFIVEEFEATGAFSQPIHGYITSDDEVFIKFKDMSLNVGGFKLKAFKILGLSTTNERLQKFEDLYSDIAVNFSGKKSVAKEVVVEVTESVTEEENKAEEVIEKVNDELTESVLEEKPKRRGRRRKTE